MERLDRGFANNNWFQNHDNVQLINLPTIHSNHGDMVLFTQKEKPFYRRPYCFEAMWTTHPGCEKVIRNAWTNTILGSPSFILAQNIKIVKNDLKKWNKEVFGTLQLIKKFLKQELKETQDKLTTSHAHMGKINIRLELEKLVEQERIFWMQKI